jgi:hypothetical protein
MLETHLGEAPPGSSAERQKRKSVDAKLLVRSRTPCRSLSSAGGRRHRGDLHPLQPMLDALRLLLERAREPLYVLGFPVPMHCGWCRAVTCLG